MTVRSFKFSDIPIKVDEKMPRNTIELRGHDGRILGAIVNLFDETQDVESQAEAVESQDQQTGYAVRTATASSLNEINAREFLAVCRGGSVSAFVAGVVIAGRTHRPLDAVVDHLAVRATVARAEPSRDDGRGQ